MYALLQLVRLLHSSAHLLGHSEHINQLLRQYFPGVAARSAACNQYWKDLTGGRVEMPFGHFFVCCVNFAIDGSVKTLPHKDWKNIAAGLCSIFTYGMSD